MNLRLDQSILTVPEVAALLRVNAKTVYALIRKAELRAFRVGRVMRCRREDVLQFIATQTDAASLLSEEG